MMQRISSLGEVSVNVYLLATKKIVFTGSLNACARFLGLSAGTTHSAIKNKSRVKKKTYCVRYAKQESQNANKSNI